MSENANKAEAGPALLYEVRGKRIVFPIAEGEMFIGRKDDCDLCFPDGSVSKRHVRLVRTGAKVELFDAGSRNGTLVNGEGADRLVLEPGDVIQVGKIALEYTDGADVALSQERTRAGRKDQDSFRDLDDFGGGDESTRAAGSSSASKQSRKSLDAPPSMPPGWKGSADASSEKARFTITSKEGAGKTFELAGTAPLTVGTKEGNAVQLAGEGISRYHAEVLFENGAWVLKDLGSRNGVFVGGKKIDLHELATGDEVQIGTVRLRFERLATQGASGVAPTDPAELLKLLKEDPKAFLKTPAARRGIFGVVAGLLLLLIFAGPAQQAPTAVGGGMHASFHDAFDLLRAGKVPQAREAIQRARANPQTDMPLLRDLDGLAKVWEQRKFPLTFDWKNAAATLDRFRKAADKERELRGDESTWLDAEAKTVQAEQANSTRVEDGARQMTIATEAFRRKDGQQQIEALKAALAAYRSVPRDSTLFEGAQQQSAKIRLRVLDACHKEAERRIEGEKPDWQAAIALLSEASRYAETVQERALLQKKIEDYDTNTKDEVSLNVAIDIVSKRLTERYAEAIQILTAIHKESHSYNDAQTYLHWITADRDVRMAKVLYDSGDWDRARNLLLGALQFSKDFGPDAKASVTRRLEAWARVYQAYTEGCEHADAVEVKKATELFKRTLELEPNPKNRFHFLAQARLDIIDATQNQAVQDALKDGLGYLAAGRWRDATEKFAYVVIHTKTEPQYRTRIEDAVGAMNAKEKLYQKANQAWMTDRSGDFEGSLEALRLLKHFLPPSDPQKPKAKELYDAIKKRLSSAADMERSIEQAKQEDGGGSASDDSAAKPPADPGKPDKGMELPKTPRSSGPGEGAPPPRADAPAPAPSGTATRALELPAGASADNLARMTAVISPLGHRFALVGGKDIWLCDAQTGKLASRVALEGDEDQMSGNVAFSADGSKLLFGCSRSEGGQVISPGYDVVVSVDDGKRLWKKKTGNAGSVLGDETVLFSEGKRALTYSDSQGVRVIDLETGTALATFEGKALVKQDDGHTAEAALSPSHVALSRDGRWAAIGGIPRGDNEYRVVVFDVTTRKQAGVIPLPPRFEMGGMEFREDGLLAVFRPTFKNGGVCVIDVQHGKVTSNVEEGIVPQRGNVFATVGGSPQSRFPSTAEPRDIVVSEAAGKRPVARFQAPVGLHQVAFTADGTCLVALGDTGVQLLDVPGSR